MKMAVYVPDEMYERMKKAHQNGLNISKMLQEAFLKFEDGEYDGDSVERIVDLERRLEKIHKLTSKCTQLSKQS